MFHIFCVGQHLKNRSVLSHQNHSIQENSRCHYRYQEGRHIPLPHIFDFMRPCRIPKSWKWSGPLYLNSNEEPLCNTQIHRLSKDPTETLKLSHCFDDIKTIQIKCLYNNADFFFNLGVFRVPPQIGILGPEEAKDSKPLSVLVEYLEKAKKASVKPFLVKLDLMTRPV